MYSAEGFENEQTGVFNEVVQTSHQEEIVHQHLRWKKVRDHLLSETSQPPKIRPFCRISNIVSHRFTFSQLLLSTVKIKVDVQTFQELSDGVSVCVGFLKVKKRDSRIFALPFLRL